MAQVRRPAKFRPKNWSSRSRDFIDFSKSNMVAQQAQPPSPIEFKGQNSYRNIFMAQVRQPAKLDQNQSNHSGYITGLPL